MDSYNRTFTCLFALLILAFSTTVIAQTKNGTDEIYQCLPCGAECDDISYTKPGKCEHCQMELVKKSTVVFKNIPASDICSFIENNPNVILLDVRTKKEFEGKADPDFGSLKNAINIPIKELEKRYTELNEYKDKQIVVFCSHSHRSPQASYLLTQKGFNNITNMSGGMSQVKNSSCKK